MVWNAAQYGRVFFWFGNLSIDAGLRRDSIGFKIIAAAVLRRLGTLKGLSTLEVPDGAQALSSA